MANCVVPEELVMNILKRLPVKTLKRFECVSPAWRDLIKSPLFKKMHFKHQKLVNGGSISKEEKEEEYIMVLSSPRTENGNAELLFYTRGERGELVPKPAPVAFPVFPHRKMELCPPCNGVFSVVSKIEDNEIYLCNPATRECRRLPQRPFGFHSEKFPNSGVSDVCRDAWGFGLDSRTDELKFVSVMHYYTPGDRYYFDTPTDVRDPQYDLFDTMVAMYPGIMPHGIIQFEIYDLASNSWREIDVKLPNVTGLARRKNNQDYVYTFDGWRGGGLFLNGCLHWVFNACLDYAILCFNIGAETVQAFKLPFFPCECPKIVVLGNSLATIQADENTNSRLTIWVMKEHGVERSWVKRFSFPPYPTFLHPLLSWKDDDADLLLFQANEPQHMETLVSRSRSGGGYHTYPLCEVKESFLVLRAIIISEQTLLSV